jgi:hypothetical protein
LQPPEPEAQGPELVAQPSQAVEPSTPPPPTPNSDTDIAFEETPRPMPQPPVSGDNQQPPTSV